MKAIVFERHGGSEVLQYRDTPQPKAGPNDVVINVKASACNFNDIWARRGLPGMKIILRTNSVVKTLDCEAKSTTVAASTNIEIAPTSRR